MWLRLPVVWVGAAILFASILACIVTIVLAWRNADTPVDTDGGNILKVPLRHSTAAAPPAQENR